MDILGLNIWYWVGALAVLVVLFLVSSLAPKQSASKKKKK